MAAFSQVWYFTPRHRLIYRWRNSLMKRLGRFSERPIDSVVIPCYGEKYVEEASLSAFFAHRSMPGLKEIRIVTDQPASAFTIDSHKIHVDTLILPPAPVPAFQNIWQSRIVKIQAPLQCQGPMILMVDSDLMILKDFQVPVTPNTIMGSFRTGKMAFKLKGLPHRFPEMRLVRRPHLKTHLNGAFLAADREIWQQLSPLWLDLFQSIWGRVKSTERPPTDQLPLAIALDRLGLNSGDLGFWANWPVAKEIGGQTAPIPREVIGAHAGFPLSEYQKLLKNRDAPLTFQDQQVTRKVRYLPG
ncbi:MAG: hypothetical protein HQL52_13705 [Magnetococcales bacterium]|nr:hypothetical protein [Magnetococcales bacterium]